MKETNSKRVYVNSRELSDIVNLPLSSIQRLVREGRIPAYKIDRKQYLFKLEEVIQYIDDRRIN